MPKTTRGWVAVVLALGLLLSACGSQPTTPTPTEEKPDVAYTAAAATIIAQLTEIANPPTKTPASGVQTTVSGQPAGTMPAPGEIASTDTPLPSDTPELSATPTVEDTPTATSAPTPTTVSGDPREELGQPSWRDTFASAENWPLYDDEHVQMRLKDGGLQMTALNADKHFSWMLAFSVLKNFYLEVTASPGACSGLDQYGLIARSPDAVVGYLFAFSCDGRYSLRRWDGKRSLYLEDWTPSDFILKGANQTNRLGLEAIDNHLSLYANGNLLAEVTDGNYPKGGFGVLIGATETAGFKVQVSQVQYWELP
jgi:hypothetical protein